ncbi:hypothetical protein D3C87_1990440 [compost metagenome]
MAKLDGLFINSEAAGPNTGTPGTGSANLPGTVDQCNGYLGEYLPAPVMKHCESGLLPSGMSS